MALVKLIKKLTEGLFGLVSSFLTPEDFRVRKLLALPTGVMRELLPGSPVSLKDVFVLFDYQNRAVRLIVKSIKYKNNWSLRKHIAGYLYEEIIEMSSEIALFSGQSPLLLPMPMSRGEKKKRGFNQCEELVKEIKKMSGDTLEVSYNALKKVKETDRQTSLGREQRSLNVKNSMSVPDEKIGTVKNKTVIVLDDVYTTGATLAEARRALLGAGARRTIGLFIAH